MVQLHAWHAGVTPPRATTDVDAALHLETGTHTYTDAASRLTDIGFVFDDRPDHAYRFRRGDDVVDLMEADHLGPAKHARHAGKDVLSLPAGKQALSRTVDVDGEHDGAPVRLSLPNLLGAIVLKAEAHLSDGRSPDRHLEDGIVLLACVDDVEAITSNVRGSDRTRLRHLAHELDHRTMVWTSVDSDTAALARANLDLLVDALGP